MSISEEKAKVGDAGCDMILCPWEARAKQAEASLARLRSRGQALVQWIQSCAKHADMCEYWPMHSKREYAGHLQTFPDDCTCGLKEALACADALAALLPDAPTDETSKNDG